VSTQFRLDPENLGKYLERRGLIPSEAEPSCEPAGEGNINWVRRARLRDGASFVVKQARPALERFPEYEVTTERIVFEARYYEIVRPYDEQGVCPAVLDFDATDRVLVLEDLGPAPRLDHTLETGRDPAVARAAGQTLGRFLGAVHAATAGRAGLSGRFANDDMRKLHGDHIFHLPFRENDFAVAPAIRERAEALWRDEKTVALADEAYRDYLSPEGALVHADVQGGNVLLANGRTRLLDAEIAHVGDEAFDVGILIAHLVVAAAARSEQAALRDAVATTLEAYTDARGGRHAAAHGRVFRHAGIELVRRTLGAARLAITAPEPSGLRVLDLGLRWLRNAPANAAEALAGE
jgi:5-methylthioribose kinase